MSALPLPPDHPLRRLSGLGGLFGNPVNQPGMADPASEAKFALAAQLLARANSGQGFGANVGGSLLAGKQAQQQAMQYNQQQQQAQLEEEYRRTQMKQMGIPSPRAPVVVRGPDGNPVYADPSQAIGQQPYMEPRGNSQGPSELEIAQALNDPNTPEGVKRDLRALIDKKYRDPAGEPLVAIQTPNGPVLVPRSQATGSAPAATREAPSEGERTSANYLGRMEAAEKLLGDYQPGAMDYFAATRVMESGPVAAGAFNKVLSGKGQQYYQAAADWVRAKLRKESGAVISPEEMAQEIKTYFPVPGDTASTREQKRIARMQAAEGFRGMSGRAAQSTTQGGTPDDPLGLR